jgi:hypothetical protein
MRHKDTVCQSGKHDMTPDNVWIRPSDGTRYCRACKSQSRRIRRVLNEVLKTVDEPCYITDSDGDRTSFHALYWFDEIRHYLAQDHFADGGPHWTGTCFSECRYADLAPVEEEIHSPREKLVRIEPGGYEVYKDVNKPRGKPIQQVLAEKRQYEPPPEPKPEPVKPKEKPYQPVVIDGEVANVSAAEYQESMRVAREEDERQRKSLLDFAKSTD